MHDLVKLVERNVPTILVCSTPFEELARGQAVVLGGMHAQLAIVPHPLASLPEGEVGARAEEAARQILGDLWKQ